MRNILLSNDDGINSRGIWELKAYFEDKYRVFIVAPDRERSATGHSISLREPIRLKEIEKDRIFAVDGTPVDSVYIAILGIIKEPIDIVITGINNGLNLGTDVFYSGTVSAAFQAASRNIPGIAVSIDNREGKIHYETAAHFTGKIVNKIEKYSLVRNVILNINVPNVEIKDVNGIEITRIGKRYYEDNLIETEDPENNKYYLIDGELSHDILEEETDVKAIHENKVSISPLHWDITAHKYIAELKNRGFHILK